MKALVQRVNRASVEVDGKSISEIGRGLLVFVGVFHNDTESDSEYLVSKIINLRIFPDRLGKFDRSILDINGELLLVSQFTLCADTMKGRRPSFLKAAEPTKAHELFEYTFGLFSHTGLKVETGEFQAHMQVFLNNDGPVTIIIDSNQKD